MPLIDHSAPAKTLLDSHPALRAASSKAPVLPELPTRYYKPDCIISGPLDVVTANIFWAKVADLAALSGFQIGGGIHECDEDGTFLDPRMYDAIELDGD